MPNELRKTFIRAFGILELGVRNYGLVFFIECLFLLEAGFSKLGMLHCAIFASFSSPKCLEVQFASDTFIFKLLQGVS
jgi:hypothetical protein